MSGPALPGRWRIRSLKQTDPPGADVKVAMPFTETWWVTISPRSTRCWMQTGSRWAVW
jgi:hypothetical protein